MSETFKTRLKAPGGEKIAAGAFDRQLGNTVKVSLPDGREAQGILRAAFVPDDGTYADVTVEVPDGTLPPSGLKRYSIGT